MALSYSNLSANILSLLLISVTAQSAPVPSDQQKDECSIGLYAKRVQFYCTAVPLKNLAGIINVIMYLHK